MLLTFIRLLAIALAFALPIQGLAAMSAGLCMAFDHHQGVAAAGETHEHDATDTDDHTGHSHADGENQDSKAAHCGPCTACCASASISAGEPFTFLSFPSHPAYVLSQYPPLSVEPSGLYRPPLAL